VSLSDLLGRARHVLLDFDGPICAVYGGTSDRAVADHLRTIIGDAWQLPEPVVETSDPLVVLRHCADADPGLLRRVEAEFIAQEVAAVATATATPDAREAMTSLAASGHTITVVSNNSAEAIRAYIERADLVDLVDGIIGRTRGRPDLMKPHPHPLRAAIVERGADPSECVMVGDSGSDIEAARAAGTASIGYANRPTKRQGLASLGPDAIIEAMNEVADAVNGMKS